MKWVSGAGFPSWHVVVALIYLVLVIPSLQTSAQAQAEQKRGYLPELATAAAIRRLSPEQAALGYPVRLEAVVTLVDPGRTVFLQDDTGGTFAKLGKESLPHVSSGQRIAIEGVTYPGLYVPGIEPRAIRILGPASMPASVSVTMETLASGHHNYEWVDIRGIVRAVDVRGDRTVILLAGGGGRLEIHVPGEIDAQHLVDAAVRVTGLAAGFINDKRQLVAPHLRIRDLSDISVEVPAPDEPFQQASIPAGNLLRFSPEQRPGHRVKIEGVVTLQEPDRAIFLRDGGQGLYVETSQQTSVRPGDTIEVLGFPEMGRFSAYLQDATFRVVKSGAPPAPVYTNAHELLRGAHDADLVTLDAQLLKPMAETGETVLLMQSGDNVFRTRGSLPEGDAFTLRPGSTLSLTGVCRVAEADFQATGFRSNPRAFELLLRSPEDLAIVKAAPWWTAQRLAIAAGVLTAATAAALGWAALLRHQVRRQTALLRDKVEAEAVTAERQRLAREFHDTLEQELVGLSLRLDALATRVSEPKPRELLDSTRKLVQRLQVEARALVWDLRDRISLRGDLAAAISEATRSIGSSTRVHVSVSGRSVSLPEITQHHLVRIAQEAVTNAVKHAQAVRIDVHIIFGSENIQLRIADNGSGFEPEDVTVNRPGHFGLIGMRERARKAGAQITIDSSRAHGTTVEVIVSRETCERAALPERSAVV